MPLVRNQSCTLTKFKITFPSYRMVCKIANISRSDRNLLGRRYSQRHWQTGYQPLWSLFRKHSFMGT